MRRRRYEALVSMREVRPDWLAGRIPLALHQIRWVLVVLALPMSHQPNPPFERTYARGAGSGRST